MSRRKRFWDNAGFGNHCWECENSTDWKDEDGRCSIYGFAVTKYDSPNNICSVGRICHSYTRDAKRKPDSESRWFKLFGTPEKAARTLTHNTPSTCDECVLIDMCDIGMPATCMVRDYDALLEWLRGDAE